MLDSITHGRNWLNEKLCIEIIRSKEFLVGSVFSKLKLSKGLMAGLLLGGTLGSFGVAAATSSPSTTVFYACLNVKAGTMNHISTAKAPKCATGNINTSWNAAGQKGDTGSQGADGRQGATGPRGLQGLTGDTGPQGLKGETGTPQVRYSVSVSSSSSTKGCEDFLTNVASLSSWTAGFGTFGPFVGQPPTCSSGNFSIASATFPISLPNYTGVLTSNPSCPSGYYAVGEIALIRSGLVVASGYQGAARLGNYSEITINSPHAGDTLEVTAACIKNTWYTMWNGAARSDYVPDWSQFATPPIQETALGIIAYLAPLVPLNS